MPETYLKKVHFGFASHDSRYIQNDGIKPAINLDGAGLQAMTVLVYIERWYKAKSAINLDGA